MLLSQRYPLADDLGFPDGVCAARQRWALAARRKRTLMRWSAVAASVALTFVLAFFGMLPWMIQRANSPTRLAEKLSSPMPHGNAHLGAEYYNISTAIVDGRGFSDPFGVDSGPTAWMPPLLPWFQAGLIWLCSGDRYLVMVSVVTLKTFLLAMCSAAVICHGWRTRDGWVAFGVVAAFLISEFDACFSFTHDGWWILAMVTGTVFGLSQIDRLVRNGKLSMLAVISWGCFGGVIALSSPVAGFAWAVGTSFSLMGRAPIKWILAGLISIAVVTPWAIRNRVVLGKFVPIKSNVFFEFDQSLAVDSDGLLDWKTFKVHPYHAGAEQDAYLELGEIAYIKTKKDRFLWQVKSDPHEFLGRIRNRLSATTLWPVGFSEFRRISFALPLRWLLYPLPAMIIVWLVFLGRPLSSLQRWSIVIYVAYLFPYVICSYYPRYGFPLLVIKMLLCYWAIERMIASVRHRRAILA